jgi:hypothetical protein
MSFLGDTMLVPEHGELPHSFAFFKVIKANHTDAFVSNVIPPGTHIGVTPKNRDSIVIVKVVFSHVYDNHMLFLVRDDVTPYEYSVNTKDHYIIEVEDVEGKKVNPNLENIGDAEENELIEQLRRDPSLAVRIPQVLWDRPMFQRKILSANLDLESDLVPENVKTMARLKRLHFLGKSYTFDHPGLPDELLAKVNKNLGIHSDPEPIHAARVEKIRRPQRQTARGWFSRFRMFGRGTRKNKGKRYGRL